MEKAIEIIAYPLVLPIFMALLCGALAYALSRFSVLAAKTAALAGCILVIVLAIGILRNHPGICYFHPWVRLVPSVTLSLDLAATTLGMVVVLGSAGFALLVAIHSLDAMAATRWEGKFYAYLTWALAGACIVGLAGDLLVLLVGWELVTLMLFLMINQGRGHARAGAAKAYGMLGFADACLLMAVVLLMARPGGSLNLSLTRVPLAVASMGATGYIVYALILVAALAKAGAVPLHSWIPTAATDAPAPVTALLPGSVDKLLGIYLLAVVMLRLFAPDATMAAVVMGVGCLTLLAAGTMAVMQGNIYKALAFDAVSQVGYMAIGLGAGVWLLATGGHEAAGVAGMAIAGGLFHMLNHATYKSSLFLMAGNVHRATGTAEMTGLGGLAQVMPVTMLCGLVASLAAAGVPPFSGFASKWMVFQGALSLSSAGGLMVLLVAVFASALSLAMFVKLLYAIFLAPRPAGATHTLRPPLQRFLSTAPMVLLAAVCILLGVWPGLMIDKVFAPILEETLAPGVAVGVSGPGLWQPGPATGLILLGIAGGLVFLLLSTYGRKARVVRPFLGGEVPLPAGAGVRGRHDATGDGERFRMPGTHFYETIGKLPIIGGLLTHGQAGAMDVYRWSGKYGHTFVELLRSLHTGLINLYVAWVVLGLTAILVYLLLTVGI